MITAPTVEDAGVETKLGNGRSARLVAIGGQALDAIVVVVMVGTLIVIVANVAALNLFHSSLLWTQEIARVGLTVLAFIGGAAAYRRGQHVSVELVLRSLPDRSRAVLEALSDWAILMVGIAGAGLSIGMAIRGWNELSPILQLQQTWFAVSIPVSMLIIAAFAAVKLLARPRRTALVAGAIALVAIVALLAPAAFGVVLPDPGGVALCLILLLVLLAIGVPVGFGLATVAFLFGYVTGSVPPSAAPSTMLESINNPILLAIPFFIFAGLIMTAGGLSRPLSDLVGMLVGRIPGGLLHVVVVTMYLFSGLSGSKLADVAAVGSSMKDVLRRNGYPPEETAAVLAASASMGETVPPSIAMIVLGSITSLSIGALFAAGIIPAAVIALCLMAIIYVRARRSRDRRRDVQRSLLEGLRVLLRAVPALLVPVILVGGIVTGVATPTEVSTFAVIYGLLVALLYRMLSGRGLWELASEAAASSGMILFITAMASAFSWTLAIAQVPQAIAAALSALPGGGWVFLLGSAAAIVVMGALLEGLPALLIFGPLLVPVAAKVGVDPLQFGIVLIVAMGVGAFLPPIGIGAYVACSVAGADLTKMIRAAVPYLVALGVGIVLIALVPEISLWLPRQLALSH